MTYLDANGLQTRGCCESREYANIVHLLMLTVQDKGLVSVWVEREDAEGKRATVYRQAAAENWE